MALAIECRGLTRSYGARRAVQGLDLEIRQGAVVGFLGPNGAGKTTVIRILTTILSPDSGSFAVAGVPGDRPAEIRRRVGVLPESAGYPENQTGADVLTFHAQLFGQSRPAARATADRLLAQVGLADRAGSRVAGYSRGMRQRLGIARALVNRPDVIFLDEPTLGLDPAGQRQVLGLIASVARDRGATVLLSTHLLAEVENVCDRVVVLNQGRVVADGSVQDVARRAAAPRQGRLSVPPARVDTAFQILAGLREVEATERTDVPGELRFGLREGIGPEEGAAGILAAVLAAAVPVVSFEFERGRLSDAFLALTDDTAEPAEPAVPEAEADDRGALVDER
jgi:ABC-2 type transport system ATP-binding protein